MALTLLHFAWRSCRRHLRRSLLLAALLAGGLFVLVFLKAMQDGYVSQRLEHGLGLTLGHVTVAPGDASSGGSLTGAVELAATLTNEGDVVAAAARIRFTGLLRCGDASVGVSVLAVDADAEAAATRLPHAIVRGSFLEGTGEPRPLALGAVLADRQDLRLGDEVVLVAEAHDGALVAQAFIITGIFETGGSWTDAGLVCIPRVAAQELMALQGEATEIIVRAARPEDAPALAARVAARPELAAASVRSWRETAPEMVGSLEMLQVMEQVRTVVLFALVALGIFAALTLSLYERRHEFGVLMALGMSPWAVFGLLAAEVGLVAGGGLVVGTLVTVLITTTWLGREGVDFSTLGATLPGALEGLTVVYPVLRPGNLLSALLWVFLVALTVLIVPAWRMLRADPAAALRDRS